MNEDFIILDIGKIVIIREKNEKKYYKEINHKLYDLTEEELIYIHSIFNNNKRYDYDSEKLTELVKQNDTIEYKDYILKFLEFLERIIPENCQDNFYRNVQTLKTNLNFNDSRSVSFTEQKEFYEAVGNYNTENNFLTIFPPYLNKVWEIAQRTNDPKGFYQKEVDQIILHELFHMASSNYDPDTTISLCGFDKYPPETEYDKNRGLTEGLTETLAMVGVPGTIEVASGYYIEVLLVNQLTQIVGTDVMLTSYFSNNGTKDIELKLNEIINDEYRASHLFRRIEDNFLIKNINGQQSILGNIQMTLINYFKMKLLNDYIADKTTRQLIIQSIHLFEQMLITPEKLKMMQKNPKNYSGIVESIELFNKIKAVFQGLDNNDMLETIPKKQAI